MTDEQLLVDTSDLVHIDNTETINGLKYFSHDTVVANASQMITNCITKIPQDIKLELNNGTFTLKAGSKVYVPDGSGVFNTIAINSDIVCDFSLAATEQLILCYNQTDNSVWYQNISGSASGASNPTMTGFFYNTTDNRVYYLRSGTPDSLWFSFPIAIMQVTSGIPTSIDQVFNGFGYIGSTAFVLPGIKGLIPNGRNDDGTLKNIEYINTIVRTRTFTWDISSSGQYFAIATTGLLSSGTGVPFYQQEETPPGRTYAYWYKPSENIMYSTGSGTTWNKADLMVVGKIVGDDTGKITSFTQKRVFSSLDYNDKSMVSGLSMPSGKYIDLTLGVSGTQYVAPANGWFSCIASGNTSSSYLHLINNSSGVEDVMQLNGRMALLLPAKKGETVKLNYNAISNLVGFKFIYAEGEV